MNAMETLDSQLTTLLENFEVLAKDLSFDEICELTDDKTVAQQNYRGIYRIDVHSAGPHVDFETWMTAFKLEWEHSDFKKKFTPNTKKKRIRCHSSLEEWIPLYIGKSKKVAARVWEHINLDLEKTTFALKLKARPTMAARRFRLSTINLKVENYDVLAPVLEKALRNRFNPIIGKQ